MIWDGLEDSTTSTGTRELIRSPQSMYEVAWPEQLTIPGDHRAPSISNCRGVTVREL